MEKSMMQNLQHCKQVITCLNHSEYLEIARCVTNKQKELFSAFNLPYFEMNYFMHLFVDILTIMFY